MLVDTPSVAAYYPLVVINRFHSRDMAQLSIAFCRQLAKARREKGMTQSALAGAVGCKQSAISMLESGQSVKIAQETPLYKDVIEPVCTDFGFQVIRGDNVYTNGLIIEDITRSIRECSIVIADITPNNANVYYELGFAHGIGKPAILLSDRNRDKLPFDISGFRLLFYDNTIGGKTAVEQALRKHLEAIRGT